MSTNSHSHVPKSAGKPSQKSGDYFNSKGETNPEQDVQQAHANEMVRYQQTFGSYSSLSSSELVKKIQNIS